MMERFDCHNIAERNKNNNSKHAIMETRAFHMETRSFRIGPVRRGADDDVIVFLDKHPRGPYPRAGYEYVHDDDDGNEEDDDDDLAIAVPNRVPSGTYNRILCENPPMLSHTSISNCNASHGFGIVDARDDDEPSPMILRTYNHSDHHSPRGHHHQQQQQHHHQKAIATGGRASTETEKRIAQLRNAGLSISYKGDGGLVPPLCSPPRIVVATNKGFRSSPRHAKEEREPPAQGFDDDDVLGDNNHNHKTSLWALLEKDSKHRQQRGKEPPPPQHAPPTAFDGGPKIFRGCSIPKNGLRSPSPRTTNALETETAHEDNAHDADAFCVDIDPIIAARPAYQGLRVSPKEYPDPEAFGWAFVGSCPERRVEFFEKKEGLGRDTNANISSNNSNSNNNNNNNNTEKGIAAAAATATAFMVLEFHYTTGTVKVTLEHPLWGSSLLVFARGGSRVLRLQLQSPPGSTDMGMGTSMGISPKIYRKILIDPLGCSSSSNSNISNNNSPSSTTTTPNHELVVCSRSVPATQQYRPRTSNNDVGWQQRSNRKKLNHLETSK
jgi:hypothetical protein